MCFGNDAPPPPPPPAQPPPPPPVLEQSAPQDSAPTDADQANNLSQGTKKYSTSLGIQSSSTSGSKTGIGIST